MRSVIPVFTQIITVQSRCSNSSKEVSTCCGSPKGYLTADKAASRKRPLRVGASEEPGPEQEEAAGRESKRPLFWLAFSQLGG